MSRYNKKSPAKAAGLALASYIINRLFQEHHLAGLRAAVNCYTIVIDSALGWLVVRRRPGVLMISGLEVSGEELAKRRAAWKAPAPHSTRGYVSLFSGHVEQADLGCDFDFLKGSSGDDVRRDCH